MRYFFYFFKKKLKPIQSRLFFNTSLLSQKKKNKILSKCGIKISSQTTIMAPFYYEFGNIEFSGKIYINANCTFLDNESIIIKNGTMIAPNVTLTTASHSTHPVPPRHVKVITSPIFIGENVWIGAGSVILPGVTIGDNSVIAANSVVNTNIPSNCLYAGSPAIFKKFI